MRNRRSLLVVLGCVVAAAVVWQRLGPRVAALSAARKVVHARAEHDVERARADLIEALDLAPADAEARAMLAQLELDANRLEPAFLHFQALTELQPGNARAWLGLARVRIAAGQPEEAEAALTRAIEAGLSDEPSIRLRAELRYRFGRYAGARIDAERALRLDPNDAQARLIVEGKSSGQPLPRRSGVDRAEGWPGELGEMMRSVVSRLAAKDWASADALAFKAGQTWPATLMGPWLAGLIRYQQGDLGAAETSFREALRRSPRSHRVVTNLMAVWSRQGGPLRVGDELSKLAEPGFVYPLPIAARAYLEGDQPAKAEASLRKELEMLPDSPVPFRDLAAFDLEIDRASEAIAACDRGLSRFPHDADLHVDAGRAATLLGDRTRAIHDYESALAERPDDQVAAAELAALLVEEPGQRDRAHDLVRTLERDAPIDPDVLGAIGIVLLEVGEPARARQFLEPASAAAPSDARLHYRLAVALDRTGERSRALNELGLALKGGRPFRGEAEARRLQREWTR